MRGKDIARSHANKHSISNVAASHIIFKKEIVGDNKLTTPSKIFDNNNLYILNPCAHYKDVITRM